MTGTASTRNDIRCRSTGVKYCCCLVEEGGGEGNDWLVKNNNHINNNNNNILVIRVITILIKVLILVFVPAISVKNKQT